MFNCMSQKSEKQETSKPINSLKIKNLIKEKRFAILRLTDTIVRLKISKTLIDGTSNEYYNKLTVVDTLSTSAATTITNTLVDDNSYDWEVQIDKGRFDPEHQLLLKSKAGQLTVLFDTKANAIGFIDLLGQEIVGYKPKVMTLLGGD
ncbi:hypothetical protein ACFQZJ_00930 [Maribacter chungangensis]|uniref:Uncharacterized protein n=1 Tax=Maribacter chungangensis TaxID=1069117 RepID=A0ABW3AY36_9FLAO